MGVKGICRERPDGQTERAVRDQRAPQRNATGHAQSRLVRLPKLADACAALTVEGFHRSGTTQATMRLPRPIAPRSRLA